MKIDDVWPRTPEYRFRLYAFTDDGHEILAAAPDAGGVGQAIITLHEDEKEAGGRLADRGHIGILDVCPGGKPGRRGEWVLLPFGRTR